jgi:antitoxin (DNA-binding transcriptional repressor) of toxin-antitoxin stability system
MPDRVSMDEAAEHLPELVAKAAAGEEVVILDGGREVARLVASGEQKPMVRRKLGVLEGKYPLPKDFDAPLPDDVLKLFED